MVGSGSEREESVLVHRHGLVWTSMSGGGLVFMLEGVDC